MGLDYRHTCPEINKNINDFKSDIEMELINMISECCPLLIGEQQKEFISSYSDSIYKSFEYYIEAIRETNQDIRNEADRQIDHTETALSNACDEIEELGKKIQELEDQVYELSKNY